MSRFEVTPKNLLLGVLQARENNSIPIKVLTEIGELFGFSSNVVRVNVARLSSSGVLESDERGSYRIASQRSLLSQLIDNWRLGEQRRKSWDGDWLVCLLPGKRSAGSQKHNQRALGYLGFKEAELGMWLRPNNLQFTREESAELLVSLGLVDEAILFVGSDFDPLRVEKWSKFLWPLDKLQQGYQELASKLQTSDVRLKKLPIDQALVEAFIMGSEAVNLLATDPLLPEEIMPTANREALTAAMEAYDITGKQVWKEKFSDIDMPLSPVHLRLVD